MPRRIFHDEGRSLAIDQLSPSHVWITQWDTSPSDPIIQFVKKHCQATTIVLCQKLTGKPSVTRIIGPDTPILIQEHGIVYELRFAHVQHPGLFLDHEPLRAWLTQRSYASVLNTFCYTASLSLACLKGGSKQVTSIDLSQATINWATRNMELNTFAGQHTLLAEDVFAWMPRAIKQKKLFDCVILDPPSFSRSKKKIFSVHKDLLELHTYAWKLLAPHGTLISSINTSNMDIAHYAACIQESFQLSKRPGGYLIIKTIDLPVTHPTRTLSDRYLKGFVCLTHP